MTGELFIGGPANGDRRRVERGVRLVVHLGKAAPDEVPPATPYRRRVVRLACGEVALWAPEDWTDAQIADAMADR